MTRKRALGRGLDALIGAGARRRDSLDLTGGATLESADAPMPDVAVDDAMAERLERLPLGQLMRGKYQPRRDIQPEALEELADSHEVVAQELPAGNRTSETGGGKDMFDQPPPDGESWSRRASVGMWGVCIAFV